MKKKVAQIGTFDVENFGDLLFPTVLSKVLKKNQIDVDIFSPYGGKKPFEEEIIVYPISELENMLNKEKYSAIIIGGGDLIRMDTSIANTYEQSITNSLLVWEYPIIIAKKYGIPIIFNAPGVPFYFNEKYQVIVKFLIENVDYVAVRDFTSKKILNSCGLKSINVVPDTILYINNLLPKEKLNKLNIHLQKEKIIPNWDDYIIFQHNKAKINDKKYINKLKKLINHISSTNKKIVFMPIGYVHDDEKFMNKIYDSADKNQYLIKSKLSPIEMLSIIARSKGFIGTSMHGIITSYAYGNAVMMLNPLGLTKIDGISEIINLKNANIRNVDMATNYYQNDFYCQTNRVKSNVDQSINEHFEKIISLINNFKNNKNANFESSLLSLCQNNIIEQQQITRYMKVYYDRGYGYSENDSTIIPYSKKSTKIKKTLKIDSDVKEIRIDPLENEIICVNKVSITGNNEDLNFNIENTINAGDKEIILSCDPKIMITTSGCTNVNIELEYNILDDISKNCLYSSMIKQEKYNNEKISNLERDIQDIKNRRIYKIMNFFDKCRRR